jgi:sarcosine oxidase subunit beta
MEKQAEVVIIGGGIVGTSIAYHLGKRGMRQVLLLEKGRLGEGSTGRCLGGIRYQFSTPINIRFSLESFRSFQNFQEELGVDPEFRRTGYLFLATTSGGEEILRKNIPLWHRFGIPVELLGPEEIRRRWPFLNAADILCGSYCAEEGYAGPYEVLMGYVKGAQRAGVKVYEGVEARKILVEGGKVAAVYADQERISCRWVVNAAGPYAAQVGDLAGIEIPMEPLRRQVFTTAPYNEIPEIIPLIIDLERGWYIRREREGFLLAGPQDERPSLNVALDSGLEARAWSSENALHRIPALEEMEINGGWAGLYEISPDQHAILGEAPELGGFICANGFSGHGFMHSPLTGRLVAELICEGKASSLDISPLSLARFDAGNLIPEAMTAFRH